MTTNEFRSKRVHFIRHGESLCNRLRRELVEVSLLPQQEKPVILDPGLTFEGVEQAKRLKEYIATLHPEIAVSSPYTRALQTCRISYGSENVIVTPLCGEKISNCDDIGLPASCLNVVYPMFDFSSLDEIWWYIQDGIKSQSKAVNLLTGGNMRVEPEENVAVRVEKFYEFLCKMPEENIVVYAHNDFLVSFLTKYFGFDEPYLDNCEVYSGDLSKLSIAK